MPKKIKIYVKIGSVWRRFPRWMFSVDGGESFFKWPWRKLFGKNVLCVTTWTPEDVNDRAAR